MLLHCVSTDLLYTLSLKPDGNEVNTVNIDREDDSFELSSGNISASMNSNP